MTAVFGVDSEREAYIPLPPGRIPVVMTGYGGASVVIDGEDGWEDMGDGTYIKHEPRVEVVPELPPEVHNTRPVDAERAIAAVRAMCGG